MGGFLDIRRGIIHYVKDFVKESPAPDGGRGQQNRDLRAER